MHQKLDAFICQCKQNFRIDKCTQDKTYIAYVGFYCCKTRLTQWEKYEGHSKHQEPYIITLTEMKKELCWQLGKEHVYINKIYDKWQKAT